MTTTIHLSNGRGQKSRSFSCMEAALEWLALGRNRAARLLAIITQGEE